MPDYRSRSNHRYDIATPSGSKLVPKYRLEILDNGAQTLVPDGMTDIYEPIQLGAEEAKISNIVARVSYGDNSALNQRVGQYFDATQLPGSLQEAMDTMARVPELMAALKDAAPEAPEITEDTPKAVEEVGENAAK